MVIEIAKKDEKERVCRQILKSLPDYFGNPESIEEYARGCRELPVWADMDSGTARGFIAFRPTSPCAGEIYVMGVIKEHHRRGLGRKLFAALYGYTKAAGFRFLTVKTVQMGRYPDYDRTNLFYRSLGFSELECFPTLWDEANPCQVYIMCVNSEKGERTL